MTPAASHSLWPGPHWHEAIAAYRRCREAGMNVSRSLVVGVIGSFKNCWMFRRQIAKRLGISVRTVARAIAQAKAEGLLRTARGKKTEVPPGAPGPIVWGFTNRWLPGWGKAGAEVLAAVSTAKARFIARAGVKALVRRAAPARRWTAEELDAELERRAPRPPPERPPDK